MVKQSAARPPKQSPRPKKPRKPTAKQIAAAEVWWKANKLKSRSGPSIMAVLPVPGGTTTWVVNNPQARPPSSSLAYETWVLEVTEYNKIMNSVAYYRWLWDQTQSKIGTG